MIDKHTLQIISKQDSADLIKGVLIGKGYDVVQLSLTEVNDGKINRLSLVYKDGSSNINTILNRKDGVFVEMDSIGTSKKKYANNPKEEPKNIVKTKSYVGDSTRLYQEDEKVIDKDSQGKPINAPFMETHGKRIAQIMWEIANQKSDPYVKLTEEEQRKLEDKL